MFRPTNGVDPKNFLSAIITILSEYPEDIVAAVCDPAHGLATRTSFMPGPKEVRDACQALWVPRIREHRKEHHRQLLEQERYVYDNMKAGPKQTVAEIKAEMAERGLDTSRWRE